MARSGEDEEARPGRGDRRWVSQIAAAYAPARRTAVQRAAFKARLRERLEQRSRWAGAPLWILAGIAALLLSEALPRGAQPPAPAAPQTASDAAAPGSWEERVLYGEPAWASAAEEIDAGLPAGHAAVAVVFLED